MQVQQMAMDNLAEEQSEEGESDDEDGEEGEDGESGEDEDEELEILEEIGQTETDPEKLKVQLFFQRQKAIKDFKEQLANLASEVLENPEKVALFLFVLILISKVSRLAHFRDMCEKTTDPLLKKFTILTEVAVYKDIIPGYRIRLPTEEESKVKLSDEVAQVRSFEQGLLTNYQKFLQYLDSIIKGEFTTFF